MDAERILVIDDDASVRRLLDSCLVREGFRCRMAATGEAGLEGVRRERPDLVILDLTLPDIDGLEVCRALKDAPATAAIPIVMLTGRDDEADVVRGFELGADDYILKPFSAPVLVARVRSALRRRPGTAGEGSRRLSFHGLTVDPERGKAWFESELLSLSLPEIRFLTLLLEDSEAPPVHEAGDSPCSRFEKDGMALFLQGRLHRVLPLLARLPEEALDTTPWLAFFAGTGRMASGHGDPRPLLEQARRTFDERGLPDGELLAGALLFYCELLLGTGPRAELGRRVEALAAGLRPHLSVPSQIQVAQCLAAAEILAPGAWQAGRDHGAEAVDLARRHDLAGVALLGLACRGEQRLRAGHPEEALGLLELLEPVLCQGHGLPPDRAIARLLQARYLLLGGGPGSCCGCLDAVRSEVEGRSWEGAVLAEQLRLLEATDALLAGRDEEALALCRHRNPAIGEERFALERLALKALAAARAGETAIGAEDLPRLLTLLNAHPAAASRAWNGTLAAAAAAALGDRQGAATALAAAREAASGLGHRRLLPVLEVLAADPDPAGMEPPAERLRPVLAEACAARAELRLACGRQGLTGLAESVLAHWGAESPAAHRLAGLLGMVVAEDGKLVPRLELECLGDYQLRREGRVILRAEDLTRSQRELLAVLVASPGMKASQDEIQLDFWPDSDPEKSRSNFDSLLSRLRKLLDQVLPPDGCRHYLQLQKGILALRHVRVDAHDLAALLRAGLDHHRRREFWQAGNAFAAALELRKGHFMPGASAREEATRFREELDRLFIEGLATWADQLIRFGCAEGAAALLHRALPVDPINDSLVKTLCRAYLKSNQLVRARQAFDRYVAALRREGYAREDIEAILAGFSPLLRGRAGS